MERPALKKTVTIYEISNGFVYFRNDTLAAFASDSNFPNAKIEQIWELEIYQAKIISAKRIG